MSLFDFRGMCRECLTATDAARDRGRTTASCTACGAVLQSGEYGIWYVAERALTGPNFLDQAEFAMPGRLPEPMTDDDRQRRLAAIRSDRLSR